MKLTIPMIDLLSFEQITNSSRVQHGQVLLDTLTIYLNLQIWCKHRVTCSGFGSCTTSALSRGRRDRERCSSTIPC
jgi:hypothetical protein